MFLGKLIKNTKQNKAITFSTWGAGTGLPGATDGVPPPGHCVDGARHVSVCCGDRAGASSPGPRAELSNLHARFSC